MKYIKRYESIEEPETYIVTHFHNEDLIKEGLSAHYIFKVEKLTDKEMHYSKYYWYDLDDSSTKLNNNLRLSNIGSTKYNNYKSIFDIIYITNNLDDAVIYLDSVLNSKKYNI